ncbi:MAG TPA: hypothetical protein VJQ51_00015 [Burkholderiales bacterium]|nr:hypothetical protein [Burkholderiales bacterium]
MNAEALLIKLRERSNTVSLSRDPLAEAQAYLRTRKDTPDGAALHRFLRGFIASPDAFLESDLDRLNARFLPLVASLIRAYLQRRYDQKQWRRALFY